MTNGRSPGGGDDGNGSALVAEVEMPAEVVGLARAITAVPEMSIEAEQLIPTREHPLPYLWCYNDEYERFEAAVAEDPTVRKFRCEADLADGRLYHVDWNLVECALLEWIATDPVSVVRGETDAESTEWLFGFRFESREGLTRFQRLCTERDITFHLIRLYHLSGVKQGQFPITEKQREAILTALDLGYFEVPRRADLEAVAERLGISSGAASERLRRGQASLFNEVLRVGQDVDREPSTVD